MIATDKLYRISGLNYFIPKIWSEFDLKFQLLSMEYLFQVLSQPKELQLFEIFLP